MTPEAENHLRLADQAFAAGRWADAETQYTRALEAEPDSTMALYGRGVARAWQSSILGGKFTVAISAVKEALGRLSQTQGDHGDFLHRVATDLINLTSGKYNELTHIYSSIAKGENAVAPTRLFAYTWDPMHPQGLSLADVYIPMINYLAAVIAVAEFLDGLLRDEEDLTGRRLHNMGNLLIFYDWMLAFNATGRVCPDYYDITVAKTERLLQDKAALEGPSEPAPARAEKAPEKPPKQKRGLGLFKRAK